MQKKNLTLKDFNKVLVAYLYEPDRVQAVINYKMSGPEAILETVKGERRGVVVALGAGILGWSLCNVKKGWAETKDGLKWHEADKFDKETGLALALNRANIASTLDPVAKESFYEKVPFSIIDLFEEMEVRAEKYFAYQKEEAE